MATFVIPVESELGTHLRPLRTKWLKPMPQKGPVSNWRLEPKFSERHDCAVRRETA